MATFRHGIGLLSVLAVWSGAAYGADTLSAPAETEAAVPGEAPAGPNYGALYFGFTFTSDYISRGRTQTNGDPAIQPFIEYNTPFGLYAGVWASTVDFQPFTGDKWEIDPYVGYRNTFGKVSVDVSYWRYYYDEFGYYGDSLNAAIDYQLTDQLTFGVEVIHDFVAEDQTFGPRFSFVPLETWKIGGKFEFARENDDVNWDIGVSKTFADVLTADLRYFDNDFDDEAKVVFSLTTVFEGFSLLK